MKTNEIRNDTCALLRTTLLDAFSEMPSDGRSEGGFSLERDSHARRGDSNDHVDGPRITHIDRAIIRNYFQEHPYPMTGPDEEALQVVGGGQLVRGQKLPLQLDPGLLGDKLERKLNALPRGYRRVIVGWDVLLIEAATLRIIDIMHNVRLSIMN